MDSGSASFFCDEGISFEPLQGAYCLILVMSVSLSSLLRSMRSVLLLAVIGVVLLVGVAVARPSRNAQAASSQLPGTHKLMAASIGVGSQPSAVVMSDFNKDGK